MDDFAKIVEDYRNEKVNPAPLPITEREPNYTTDPLEEVNRAAAEVPQEPVSQFRESLEGPITTQNLLNTLVEGQTVLVSVKFLRDFLRERPTPKVVTKLRATVQRTPPPPPNAPPRFKGRVAGRFKVRDYRLTGRNWNDSMNAVYAYCRLHEDGVTVKETSDGLKMPLSTAHNCLRKLTKKQALRWVKG